MKLQGKYNVQAFLLRFKFIIYSNFKYF